MGCDNVTSVMKCAHRTPPTGGVISRMAHAAAACFTTQILALSFGVPLSGVPLIEKCEHEGVVFHDGCAGVACAKK